MVGHEERRCREHANGGFCYKDMQNFAHFTLIKCKQRLSMVVSRLLLQLSTLHKCKIHSTNLRLLSYFLIVIALAGQLGGGWLFCVADSRMELSSDLSLPSDTLSGSSIDFSGRCCDVFNLFNKIDQRNSSR